MRRPGAVLSRGAARGVDVWLGRRVGSNAVEVHLHNLRRKLGVNVIPQRPRRGLPDRRMTRPSIRRRVVVWVPRRWAWRRHCCCSPPTWSRWTRSTKCSTTACARRPCCWQTATWAGPCRARPGRRAVVRRHRIQLVAVAWRPDGSLPVLVPARPAAGVLGDPGPSMQRIESRWPGTSSRWVQPDRRDPGRAAGLRAARRAAERRDAARYCRCRARGSDGRSARGGTACGWRRCRPDQRGDRAAWRHVPRPAGRARRAR